jgi:signal transduction histidine kinase
VAEILTEEFPADHPKRPFFDILLQEIERLKRVVQEFLDLGRPIEIDPSWLDAKAIVEDCCLSLQGAAEKKDVRFVRRVEEACQVWADSLRIHQALTNLVRNAVQVSSPGAEVVIGASALDGGCLFKVEDHGAGLPKEALGRLFEPFFSTRKDGSGLGLALVKQIAQAHGGWVLGESRTGGGARFSIWLPCCGSGKLSKPSDGSTGGEGQ